MVVSFKFMIYLMNGHSDYVPRATKT